MRILHLSDTHLTREPGDAHVSLLGLLQDCRDIPAVDAVLTTGDIADDGSRPAYAEAHRMITGFARDRGIPALFTIGNHDDRPTYTDVLGPTTTVTTIAGHRIVTLDTLVPGKGYGQFDAPQLDWLREQLAEPAPNGTVLAFHHPPITVPRDLVQRALGLQNPAALADAIRGSDVRVILCGHYHLQLFGMLESVPVWVTPGVVNRIDMSAPPGVVRTLRGASASVVDLGVPGGPQFHTVQAGETLGELSGEALAEVLRTLGPDLVPYA